MNKQVFHQIIIDRMPIHASGIVYISGIYRISLPIFNIDERT